MCSIGRREALWTTYPLTHCLLKSSFSAVRRVSDACAFLQLFSVVGPLCDSVRACALEGIVAEYLEANNLPWVVADMIVDYWLAAQPDSESK